MYAIIKIQGVQAKVAPEEVLDVPRLNGEVGQTLTFDRVLLVADGDQIKVGQPYLQGVSLTA